MLSGNGFISKVLPSLCGYIDLSQDAVLPGCPRGHPPIDVQKSDSAILHQFTRFMNKFGIKYNAVFLLLFFLH